MVVLAEDLRQQRFVRRYLYRVGYRPHEIRDEPLASGKGSGEQWVRERYRTAVGAYRSETKLIGTALIVVIDADKVGVAKRHQQLADSLRRGKMIVGRDDNEPIVHLIPKRNMETWVLCVTGMEVDEETDYHRRRIDDQIDNAARAFFDGSRRKVTPPDHWIASLLSAIPEVQRLQ